MIIIARFSKLPFINSVHDIFEELLALVLREKRGKQPRTTGGIFDSTLKVVSDSIGFHVCT